MSRMSARACLFLVCIAVGSGTAGADDFRAEASVDRRNVNVGEALTLTVTVYGGDKVSEPDVGSIEGFRVVDMSTLRNVSIVNMKVTRSLSFQYTLVALTQGEHVLGPFTVKSGNEAYETEAIKVRVAKGQAPSQQQVEGGTDEESVVLLATVDKRQAYVGQQITYTLKFAYRVRLLSGTQYIPPDHTGFWSEEIGQSDPVIEVIGGRQYYVVSRRIAFFPISSGTFTIGEAEYRFEVRELDPFSRDPFGTFGRDPFSIFGRRQGVVQSKPIEIDVLPLPREGRPADFSGAVGQFSMSVTPSAEEIMVGESLTLSIRVRGRGNLKSIGEIPLPEIRDFRVFAPKARESIGVEGGLVGGEKVFDLVLVPQRPGDYVLDGFDFSYFDPDEADYVISSAAPVTIEVLPADESLAAPLPAGGLESRIARQDVRHIKRGIIARDDLTLSLDGIQGALIRYLPVLVALAGIVVSIQRKRAAAAGRAGARRALKVLGQELKAAERMVARGGDLAEASGTVSRAVKKYIAARAGVSEAAVDEDLIGSISRIAGERRSEITDSLTDLDRIRFAPVTPDRQELTKIIDRARTLFKTVDREWH